MSREGYCFWCVIRKGTGVLSFVCMLSAVLCLMAFVLCYGTTIPSIVNVWGAGACFFCACSLIFKLLDTGVNIFLDLFGEAYRFYYDDLVPTLNSQQFLSLEKFVKTLNRKDKIHFFHTLYLLGKPLDVALSVFQGIWYEKNGVVVFDNCYRYQISTNQKGIITSIKMLTSVRNIENYDEVITKLEKYTV